MSHRNKNGLFIMKILWFYQYIEQYNYDHWFRMDFTETVGKYPGIDLKIYGLRLYEQYPKISISYHEDKLLSDIKKEFDFDIIISNTKSRMFKIYFPPLLHKGDEKLPIGCILPKDFAKWNKTPKISLEEDYHYELNDDWYVENGIDLMLQRHYSQSLRKETIKKIWYPFSVDIDVFKPNSNQQKINKICFTGAKTSYSYPHRTKITRMLKPLNCLDDYSLYPNRPRLLGKKYLNCLQSYVSHLSSSSKYYITPAKMFEIMASGGLLFTNKSNKYGIEHLFPENTYCTYEEDYSDVIQKVKMILNDKNYVKTTVERALKCIREKHNNQVRIEQLLGIIENEFKIK